MAGIDIVQIETLETRSKDAAPLQNVLSISTAGKNRYLLHFSNVNALTQWTAGIRLAMFEHSSLHETYTGALIGGKGRALNNIRTIMTQSKFQTSDWVRVRFGAGTPWRRCWCVISPPDEKETAKAQKTMKKRSTYDRTPIVLKGDVKFYELKKITKKTHPIATITNAYAAYAIYPQSKALIEQSTLIKIEGSITVHPQTQTKLESCIFVMPETHDAVSGFEMLLRFLFPIWDVFALYGRPQRLIPDTWNPKSLMFAMPKNDRWGYLDILDVTTLATLPGSPNWSEAEWRREMKKLTAERIEKISRDPVRANGRPSSQYGRPHRNSLPSRGAALRFADGEGSESRTSFDQNLNINKNKIRSNTGAAPPGPSILLGSPTKTQGHGRSVSASVPGSPVHFASNAHEEYHLSRLSHETTRPSYEPIEENRPLPPPPPAHVHRPALSHASSEQHSYQDSSEDEQRFHDAHDAHDAQAPPYTEEAERDTVASEPPAPVEPVAPPPAFSRQPGAKPQTRPIQSPELRRANSRMSNATLSQLAAAAGKQMMPNHGQPGGDYKLEKVDDAYKRPFPNSDQMSNHSLPLVNSAAPFSETNSSAGLHHPTNLQAPIQFSGRSPSPLRNMAALTPELQSLNKNSYFPDSASAAELKPAPSPPRHGHTLMPDDSERIGRPQENGNNRDTSTSPRRSRFESFGMSEDNEPKTSRNSSAGKITRKPVPVSPSRVLTEFTAPAETSPTEMMKNKDVNDALINRVNTVKSKISTSSRRYSEDESNYESSPEYESRPLPAWPEDIPLARDEFQSKANESDAQQSREHGTQIRAPGPGSSVETPRSDFDSTPFHGSTSHVDLKATKGQNESNPVTNANNSDQLEPSLPILDNNHSYPGSIQAPRNFPQRNNPIIATASPPISPEQFAQDPAAATRVPVYPYTNIRPTTAPSTSSGNYQTPYGLHPGANESLGDWSDRSFSTATTLDQQGVAPPGYTQHFKSQETEYFTIPNRSPHPSIERKPVSPGFPSERHNGMVETQIPAMTPIKEGGGSYATQSPMVQQQQQQYETHPYYRYETPGQHPQYSVPGQFPITPQYAPAAWEQQQQQNPYMNTQYQDYNGPMYGRQAPQDYYHQPQQTYNENYSPYNQQPNKSNRPYRG